MKHAYCILAHSQWNQLQLLIDAIDDSRNDIYLHIDKKAVGSYRIWGGKQLLNQELSLFLILM